ncbi:hypothetical protein BU24DRAFT_405651 [Aaosphaeria arxii CBS 175.79]|uniref:Uncharacterized protein n=1 Tax=Aaosphaeria arxii CBS 175.79 TaxID=1450172 RepID=A0A6A5Y056_9PLEO|nr:uncharacterized protein BU24DRAFT_405651 [Aaosphaeria arxii CBS 175.79]KAF2018915.1 hypothetical protein BU24DRAFT_405651 [Aaosphaeria arxii CBS 175.79]
MNRITVLGGALAVIQSGFLTQGQNLTVTPPATVYPTVTPPATVSPTLTPPATVYPPVSPAVVTTTLVQFIAPNLTPTPSPARWSSVRIPATITKGKGKTSFATPIPVRQVIWDDDHYVWWRAPEVDLSNIHLVEKHYIEKANTPFRGWVDGTDDEGEPIRSVVWEDNGREHAEDPSWAENDRSLGGEQCRETEEEQWGPGDFICTRDGEAIAIAYPPVPPDWKDGDEQYYNASTTWAVAGATPTPTPSPSPSEVKEEKKGHSPYYPTDEQKSSIFVKDELKCWYAEKPGFKIPWHVDLDIVGAAIHEYCYYTPNLHKTIGIDVQFPKMQTGFFTEDNSGWSVHTYSDKQSIIEVNIRQAFGTSEGCDATVYPQNPIQCEELLLNTVNGCSELESMGTASSVSDVCTISEIVVAPYNPHIVWEESESKSEAIKPSFGEPTSAAKKESETPKPTKESFSKLSSSETPKAKATPTPSPSQTSEKEQKQHTTISTATHAKQSRPSIPDINIDEDFLPFLKSLHRGPLNRFRPSFAQSAEQQKPTKEAISSAVSSPAVSSSAVSFKSIFGRSDIPSTRSWSSQVTSFAAAAATPTQSASKSWTTTWTVHGGR